MRGRVDVRAVTDRDALGLEFELETVVVTDVLFLEQEGVPFEAVTVPEVSREALSLVQEGDGEKEPSVADGRSEGVSTCG